MNEFNFGLCLTVCVNKRVSTTWQCHWRNL